MVPTISTGVEILKSSERLPSNIYFFNLYSYLFDYFILSWIYYCIFIYKSFTIPFNLCLNFIQKVLMFPSFLTDYAFKFLKIIVYLSVKGKSLQRLSFTFGVLKYFKILFTQILLSTFI